MALLIGTLRRTIRYVDNKSVKLCMKNLHISSSLRVNKDWRSSRGLTENPNTFGPLTNLPDYSFKDGRPTPVGIRHRIRLDKQKEYAEKILKMTAEIDFAVDRYDRMQREEMERKQSILDRKLKPKGDSLNTKSSV